MDSRVNIVPEIIGLVDFSHGLTVQQKATASDAGPNDAGQRFIRQLGEFRDMCGTVILCLDKGPYWRTAEFPGYKAGRERDPEYAAIYRWTLERAQADGYQVACAQGQEGDDIAATLAATYSSELFGCGDIRIFGADKDCCSCISEAVRMFVPKGRGEFEIRDVDWVKTRYGVEPKDMALLLAIMGDTSDRIPGVKGIGEKGAAKLIQTYGTIEKMAEACANATEAARLTNKPVPAFWRNWAGGMAELPKWLRLTTLCTEVQLEQPAIAYLQKLPVRQLVAEPEISDADDSEFYDQPGEDMPPEPDWEAVAKATAERERAELAAALPVDPVTVYPAWGHKNSEGTGPLEQRSAADRQVAAARAMTMEQSMAQNVIVPRVGKDPDADAVLEQAARERSTAAANTTLPKDAPKDAKPTAAQVDATQAEIKAGNDAERARPKDGPAATVAPAVNVTPAGATPVAPAEVVPKTQGPRKGDVIDETPLAVRAAPPSWALATQPSSAKEMLQIATALYNSPMFRQFGSERGNFAVMSYGRELGLGYMQSLMSFCTVKEKPFMWAHAMRGLVLSKPECEYLINTECSAEASTWVTRRRGWPEGMTSSYRFTYEEAVKIGLTTGSNRDNWLKNPRSMIDKTASSRLLRQVYADLIGGLHAMEESD